MFLPLSNEKLEEKTKVTLVLWPLWSWKTSLIKRLLPHYPKDTILIINDVWAINIDAKRIKWKEVVELREWCVCCEDIKSLRDALIKLKWKTQNIIIEPSWIAEWTSIKKVLTDLWYDVSTIFLWDIEHHEYRSEIENQVIKNQIKVADIVWLTWNNWEQDKVTIFNNWLKKIKPWIETLEIPHIEENQEYFPENEDKFKEIMERIISIKSKTKEKAFNIIAPESKLNKWTYMAFWMTVNHSHKAPVFTISKEINISLEQLKDILEKNKDIIRAKWIVWNREFDYVHSSLNLWRFTNEKAYITFISTEKFDIEFESENENKNNQVNMKKVDILDFELSQQKIETLVKQYNEYMELEKQIETLKEKIKNSDDKNITKQITLLQLKQKYLWESMKYDNPYIWIEYKRLAYAWTESKVETIWELRKHCESPTYICHKRLMFLNSILKENWIDIFDKNIDENTLLIDFLNNWLIQEISRNEKIMKEWLNYEYFETNDRVAKWENFSN